MKKMYEVIKMSPNGIMEGMGVYCAEDAINMYNKIRKDLTIKYGSRVANAFKIHICEIEV